MSAAAIELRGLTKDFSMGLRGMKLRAVDNLTLTIPAGEIFGLLGPNGSGKSTTIKVILGLAAPTLGTCAVFGVPSANVEARVGVGYLPESPQFYRYLTGRELVSFYARICGLGGARLKARVAEVVDWVGLADAADRRVGTYSKGMLQRIGLAQALVHDPKLVILDEPTAGVDPVGTAAMSALILQLKAQGKTVLITSHLLAQIETICDRVAILDRGRLLLEGAVHELTQARRREAVWLDALSAPEQGELREWLAARGRKVEAVSLPGNRLDEIFVEQVTAAGPDGKN